MFDLELIPNHPPLYTIPGPGGDGIQAVFRFANNYGASVIRHKHSYGVELGVVAFFGPGEGDWNLNYDTSVTSDVIGWIEDQYELMGILSEVEALPLYRPACREIMSGPEVHEFLLSVDVPSSTILEIEAVVYNDGYIRTEVCGVEVEIETFSDDFRMTLKDKTEE